MKYIITFFLLFMVCGLVYADDFPTSIEQIIPKEGFQGKFINTHDPGYIRIELASGEIIDTTYSGIDSDTLNQWKKENEKQGTSREMNILYNNAEGVTVKDLKTGITFKLNGVINPHPIDLAVALYEKEYSSTIEIKECKQFELKAWDAELNRAYKALGGSKDANLKKSQLAWIKFRDAEIEYLHSAYQKLEGSFWGIALMNHQVNLTKEQVNRMKSINTDCSDQ